MNDSMNNITLAGRVHSTPVYDHTLYGEAFFKMEIAASRLSGVEDILPVTVSERLLGDSIIDIGTQVEIIGQIRSYNQRVGENNHLVITAFAREFNTVADGSEDIDNASNEDYISPNKNEVELCGHICKQVVYRQTPFSREIADILVAVNRRYGKSDYLPCIAWGRNARYARELSIGDTIQIKGRMQSRPYQKTLSDGTVEERMAYEISCSTIEGRERY